MKLYIASNLANYKRVIEVRDRLVENNINLSFDWTPFALSIFNGTNVQPDYNHDSLRSKALNELYGVINADYLLVMLPGGNGTHFEYGSFYMRHMSMGFPPIDSFPITILDERKDITIPTSFHFLPYVKYTTYENEALETVINFEKKSNLNK